MTPSDLTADLPAPRDDEPASLRQDIADELADHLSCAVRREELVGWAVPTNERGNDHERWAQPTLHERVLARFGDPRSVARKLWWDHMRERIMKERLLTGLTLVAVVACCAMAGLMWQMQNAQRDMLRESQAQNARLIEQFQAMLAQLKPAAASEAPSEWNQLTVKCTFDTEDGAPVEGVQASIQGATPETQRMPGDTQTSNTTGVIDFGKVLFGSYEIQYQTRDGLYVRTNVAVRPGQDNVVHLVCPSAPPPMEEIKLDIQPPEDCRSLPLYYLAVVQSAHQPFANQWWTIPATSFRRPCYVLGANGEVLGELDEQSAKDLAERISKRGEQGAIIDSTLKEHFRALRLIPVVQQPGYLLDGQLLALMADPASENVPEGELPALVPLQQFGQFPEWGRRGGRNPASFSPCEEFNTNTEDRILRISHPDSFWRQVIGQFPKKDPEQPATQSQPEG